MTIVRTMTFQQKIDYITKLIDEVMFVQDGMLMHQKSIIELAYSRLLEQHPDTNIFNYNVQPSFMEYLQKYFDGTIVQ